MSGVNNVPILFYSILFYSILFYSILLTHKSWEEAGLNWATFTQNTVCSSVTPGSIRRSTTTRCRGIDIESKKPLKLGLWSINGFSKLVNLPPMYKCECEWVDALVDLECKDDIWKGVRGDGEKTSSYWVNRKKVWCNIESCTVGVSRSAILCFAG